MASGQQLYFIALIPPDDLEKQIGKFKQEIKEKFSAKHALKLPAHITLQPPFSMAEEREPELFDLLERLSKQQMPFSVKLEDFGSFPPRVIFVKVREHEPVLKLHKKLSEELKNVVSAERNSSIHPHLTIASRDLKKQDFKTAWDTFKDREFKAEFTAERIFLLKHNKKNWDVLKTFPFQKQQVN